MISLIVITHGLFGRELLNTAQDMIGRQEQAAALAVTPEMGAENLGRALEEALQGLASPDGALVLVDMLGGTPCNVSLLRTREQPVEIIAGVNLSMVLSGLTHRVRLPLKELAVKVMEDGRKAVVLPRELLARKCP